MSRAFTIAFDLDGVLANFTGDLAHRAYEMYRKPEILEPPTDWYCKNWNLTWEEISAVLAEQGQVENFWTGLSVLPDVNRDLVRRVAGQNRVFFPTARAFAPGASVQAQSACWLRINFGIMYPTVIVDDNKGPLAAALKYDYFIDDRPKNCVDIANVLPDCKVFLRDSSHNQGFDNNVCGITRINSVNDFCKIILEENEK
jgi:hypothetical protein